MINGVFGDKAQTRLAVPFPEDDVLVHGGRLQLRLLRQVEDLQCPLLGLQRNDLLVVVHDGTVGLDGPPNDVVAILEVDYDDFGGRGLVGLLPDADVRVGFKGLASGSIPTSRKPLRSMGRDLRMS